MFNLRYVRRSPLDRQGMTLVELMIAMALFAVVTTVVIGFMTGSRRTYDATSDRANYQQSMRAVFSLVTREMRSAGCDPREAGFDRLPVCDDISVRCRMDLDADGSTLGINPDEDVTYTYDDATDEILRTTSTGTMTILREVTSCQFRYFDETGAELSPVPLSVTNRDLVRFLDIDIAGELRDGEPVAYATRVFLRNG